MNDCEALDPYTFGPDQTCFGCGPHNDLGLRLRFERVGERVVTSYTAPKGHDGPPGVLHGGLQATLMDETAGWTLVGLLGRMGVTTSMSVRYVRPLRLGVPIRAEGRIATRNGDRVVVQTALYQHDRLGCSGRIGFALVDAAGVERVTGQPLPPEWARMFEPIAD